MCVVMSDWHILCDILTGFLSVPLWNESVCVFVRLSGCVTDSVFVSLCDSLSVCLVV